jgi:hypothetical protein
VTLGDWLSERSGAVPPRLSARVNEALGERLQSPCADAIRHCVDAAGELLRDLLARSSTGRDSALDLLTVDALVTYAFEAASDQSDMLSERAVAAARRFAAVAS